MPLLEKQLITAITQLVAKSQEYRALAKTKGSLVTGIGDDAAVLKLRQGYELLISTDFSLEGVHFRREWHPPESVGHRCLARGLSDIAAMGGEPFAALLSLALPPDLPQKWVDRFMQGFLRLAKEQGVTLAGGDTSASAARIHGRLKPSRPGQVLADVIVVGSVRSRSAILRSGAHAGERVFVTGSLGGSAATLHKLFARGLKGVNLKDHDKHFFPAPRVEVGRYLSAHGLATAMIDISDGLSTDLSHLLAASGVGAVVDEEKIPVQGNSITGVPKGLSENNNSRKEDLQLALHGGDDYELLFTAPAGKRIPAKIAAVKITEIGEITTERRLWLRSADGGKTRLVARGWQHFT